MPLNFTLGTCSEYLMYYVRLVLEVSHTIIFKFVSPNVANVQGAAVVRSKIPLLNQRSELSDWPRTNRKSWATQVTISCNQCMYMYHLSEGPVHLDLNYFFFLQQFIWCGIVESRNIKSTFKSHCIIKAITKYGGGFLSWKSTIFIFFLTNVIIQAFSAENKQTNYPIHLSPVM